MKILCPIDFSESSVYALEYALRLFKGQNDIKVTLAHCFNVASRSSMFVKMDELLRESAEKDMAKLLDTFEGKYDNVDFDVQIFGGDPKHLLPDYAKVKKYDFVVIGSKGMSEVKDLLIGSLTEAMFENSYTPTIAVPYKEAALLPQKILLALDHKPVENDNALDPLKYLLTMTNAQLHLCHVETENQGFTHDPMIELELGDIAYEYKKLPADEKRTVTKIVSDHLDDIDANMMVFIHRHRSWWRRLLSTSTSKEELFELDKPLLILQG